MADGNQNAPTFLVQLKDKTDGSITADVSSRITSFQYEDDNMKLDKLTLHVDNRDLALWDDERWRIGHLLQVSWGYHGDLAPARVCEIRSLRGFDTLQIEAVGRGIEMHAIERTRRFDNKKRSEVVQEIAGVYGYKGKALFVEDTKHKLPHIQQAGWSDAHFMRILAHKEGFEFFIDASGAMHFHSAKLDQAPVKELVYYAGAKSGDVLSISIEDDHKASTAKVETKGRDPLTKKMFPVAKGSNKDTKRDTLATKSDRDRSSGIYEKATLGRQKVVPSTEMTEASAKRQADAIFYATSREEVKVSATVIGDRLLAARKIVILSNSSRRFSGRYYITRAVHKIEGGGYTTALELLRDGHNGYGSQKDQTNDGTLNKKKVDLKPVHHEDHNEDGTLKGTDYYKLE